MRYYSFFRFLHLLSVCLHVQRTKDCLRMSLSWVSLLFSKISLRPPLEGACVRVCDLGTIDYHRSTDVIIVFSLDYHFSYDAKSGIYCCIYKRFSPFSWGPARETGPIEDAPVFAVGAYVPRSHGPPCLPQRSLGHPLPAIGFCSRGFEAWIWALTLAFGLQGWDLHLKAWICNSRLGFRL